MRVVCVEAASVVAREAVNYKEMSGKRMERGIHEGLLETTMVRMVDGVYGPVAMREARLREEMMGLMYKFMVFED